VTTQPSEQEQHRELVTALRAAVEDIDGLLQIASLQTASHARSLVFAMSRCHMFKGSSHSVLRALCAVAVRCSCHHEQQHARNRERRCSTNQCFMLEAKE
jgi:hypothetical protein